MIKVIDIDNLFDNYIEGYVMKNIGKLKPEEIENNIPILYEKFGLEVLDELDGFSPSAYYKNFSEIQLLDCLKEHINTQVSVPDFLYDAIVEKSQSAQEIRKRLLGDNTEEYTVYLMNLLADMGEKAPLSRYLEFVLYDENPSVIEVATEVLSHNVIDAKDDVLDAYKTAPLERKPYLVEIISNVKNDERAFDILVAEFMKNQDQIALHAGYLAKYGDERALPFLLKAIEDEKINYADFEELRFSIEALGGEYAKKRDFSADKFYKQIITKNKQ